MPFTDNLTDHKFLEDVGEESMRIQRATGMLKLSSKTEPNRDLDEYEFYVLGVSFALAHAIAWVDQLHQGVHFLSDFSYSKKNRAAGVQRNHHLIYNVENYLIRLQSVYDRLLQLTNRVFHLCINEGLVQHGLIVSNVKVERTQIPKLLKAVKNTIKDKADDRNEIVHRNSIMEHSLRRLDFFYLHDEASWGTSGRISFKHFKAVRTNLMKNEIEKKQKEFSKINSALVTALDPLLTALHHQYKEEARRLRTILGYKS